MVAPWSDWRLGAFLYLGDGSKGASHSLKISTDATSVQAFVSLHLSSYEAQQDSQSILNR